MRLRAGDRVDRFRLVEPLSPVEQGSVWKAVGLRDESLVRTLELVPIDRMSSSTFERVMREVHALSKAPHPALLASHGLFEDRAVGFTGIVLDFIEGRPLREVSRDPRMNMFHQLALLEQVATVLAHVHLAGLVHSDLRSERV